MNTLTSFKLYPAGKKIQLNQNQRNWKLKKQRGVKQFYISIYIHTATYTNINIVGLYTSCVGPFINSTRTCNIDKYWIETMSHFLFVNLLFFKINSSWAQCHIFFLLLNFEYFLDNTKKTHTKMTGLGLIWALHSHALIEKKPKKKKFDSRTRFFVYIH